MPHINASGADSVTVECPSGKTLHLKRIDAHRISTSTTPGTLQVVEQVAGTRMSTSIGNAFTFAWLNGQFTAGAADRDFTVNLTGWILRLACWHD
jgi:hypothetical protein